LSEKAESDGDEQQYNQGHGVSLQLKLAWRGDLKRYLQARERATENAVTTAMRRTMSAARTAMAKQVKSRFTVGRRASGTPLDKALKSRVLPKGKATIAPVGQVYSVARYRKRPGGTVDLIQLFETGATVKAVRGMLAIPTDKAPLRPGRGGARKARPEELNLKLPIVRAGGGRYVMLSPDRSAIWYVLVRQVVLRRRLDLLPIFARETARFHTRVRALLDRALGNVERRFGE
jgi:hypothetical protein